MIVSNKQYKDHYALRSDMILTPHVSHMVMGFHPERPAQAQQFQTTMQLKPRTLLHANAQANSHSTYLHNKSNIQTASQVADVQEPLATTAHLLSQQLLQIIRWDGLIVAYPLSLI